MTACINITKHLALDGMRLTITIVSVIIVIVVIFITKIIISLLLLLVLSSYIQEELTGSSGKLPRAEVPRDWQLLMTERYCPY